MHRLFIVVNTGCGEVIFKLGYLIFSGGGFVCGESEISVGRNICTGVTCGTGNRGNGWEEAVARSVLNKSERHPVYGSEISKYL